MPAASVVVNTPGVERAAAPIVREAPDTDSAVRAAIAQKAPVRVADMTTPTRVVDAQPDGTMTATLHASPQRVLRDGRWIGVDTTLVRRPDGTVAPRAVEADLVLSGGGAKSPLVRYGRGGKTIALTWPGKLPEPVLSGATATYPDVLPGVDLRMRADFDGYTQHLVVENASAAKQPALRRIRLGLSTQDVKLTVTRKGGLEARDAKGRVLFAAPPSAMWDSASKSARVGVALERGALVLSPDAALLRGSKTRFPVTIDPAFGYPHRPGWTKVFSGAAGTSYWQGANDVDGWAKVGYCGWGGCAGIGETRSIFQFDTGFLGGKQILSATLNAKIVYGPSCGTTVHKVYLAERGIDSGTTWGNQPPIDLEHPLDSRVAESNYTGCAGDKPIGFNVTGGLRAGGQSTYTIGGASEGDKWTWRKYDGWATGLVVHFNSRPDKPVNLGMDPPLKPACRWCAGVPYMGQENIALQATLTDPDGDNLYPQWRYSADGVETAWDGGTQANGTRHSAPVNLKNKNGKLIGWWVHGADGYWGSEAAGGFSFRVDLDPPGSKPGVSARIYQSDNRWHGGIGQPDQFTFTPTEPGKPGVRVDDIDHYLWGFQNPPTNKVDASALGGPATVNIAPTDDGPQTLYVQSKDRAGHASPTQEYRIYVRAGNGPLAQWSLDGNAEDTAFLGDRDGTPHGTVRYASGAVGTGLRLDGNGQITAPNTVRTDGSFSVTAWAKLDKAEDQSYTVVSQHGQNTCAFCIQYQADKKAWVWVLPQADQANPPGWSFVQSPAIAGEWVHLAGIHDAVTKTVKFYVDGRLVGSAPHNAPWHGADVLRIGYGYTGGIDEVKVYERALTTAEVTAEVSRDNVQLGHWKFDLPRRPEDADRTVPNAVPGGAAAVLHGGARLAPSPVNGALLLDSPDDYASTGTSVLRTDRSFTIGGWLRLDTAPAATHTSTAVSQSGAVNSAFFLGYRNTDGGRWELYVPSADSVTRPGDSVVASGPNTATLGAPAHVMGVYDASTQKIEIYVNGKKAGSAPYNGGFHATGELVVGRALWQNAQTNAWAGTVDELRAYSRALSAAEIEGLVAQSGVTSGQWRLDGLDSTTRETPDSSTRGLTAKAEGGVDLVGGQTAYPDPSDMALQFNGSTGFASAPHAINTSRSFSASAWVRLEKVGAHYGVVSQDGNRASSFKIEADPGGGWSFTMFSQDTDSGGEAHRAIGGKAQIGVWTHLAGVYDADAGKLLLYVNGVLAATRDHTNAWDHTTGRIQIGRNKMGGVPVDYLPGAIDDVAVYSRTLFADEIRVMAGRDLTLAHNWALDESSGTGAADAVGAQRAKLSGGAAFAPGRAGNGVDFDGTGAVTTDAVDLRTDASFTVSAWAFLDSTECDLQTVSECKADVVTVDGQKTSKFRLGHVINDGQSWRGAWIFEMPESDAPGAAATKAVVSTEPADLDKWVHLTGVYDAPAKKLWLYVNGNRIGDGTLNNPWPHSGGVRIGQGRDGGTTGEQWRGRIDDVRLHTGALDKDRVWSLFTSYPAERPPATLPAADLGHWKVDENTGTTLADSSGSGRTATLKGGVTWTGGRNGYGVLLDGTTAYAETAGPVVDTSRSFSVAGWAYLTQAGTASQTLVAQDGGRLSTFMLQYRGPEKAWGLVVPGVDNDSPGTNVVILTAPGQAVVGSWTHVAMTYDAGSHQVRFYVNGALVGAEVGVTVLPATGPLSIGRAKWKGGNADFFSRGVDDVRAYSRALTDGEIRKVHDDVAAPNMDVYEFDDGTGRDYTGTRNDLTVSGGASYVAGVSGKALQLDGVSGAGVAQQPSLSMTDSFSVSAWTKLDRTDRTATAVGQDGSRMSGYLLQYRPALKRWVFGGPVEDSDSAELAYVAAPAPAVAGQWTHVTGVYDYPARQLRIYVDGKLGAVRDNVALWRATGPTTVGRGRFNGAPADFFLGALDDVNLTLGAMSDAAIARQGSWPAPPEGQLGRFVNAAGERYTGTTTTPPDGYHHELTLGLLVRDGQPNTRLLYSCRVTQSGDTFTSVDAACEGQTGLGEVGRVYIDPPAGVVTMPIYRCWMGSDHFESRRSDCEGGTNERVLGHTVAYAQLMRYAYDTGPFDHASTVDGGPPGYKREYLAGWVPLVAQPGTVPLMSCQEDFDYFVSTDQACEGKTVLAAIGHVWTAAPAGVTSQPIYRCVGGGQRFVSVAADCEGTVLDRQLGFVQLSRPIGEAA